MSPGQRDLAMKVEAIRLYREQKTFTSKRAFSIQLDRMGQICERALSKRFAHRDLVLHRFSVESMAMVGCVYVGKALVRAPKPRRFVAPCAESAGCVHGEGCAGVGGVLQLLRAAWLGCSAARGVPRLQCPRFMSQPWLCFTWHGKCCQKKSLFPTTGKKQTSALCRSR
jgi:hypothetical protein